MRSAFLSRVRISRAALLATLIGFAASSARAQANLSSQGFGFPPGQFSSRTWGTGGAIAELDPLSPVNPASVALHPSRIVEFQLEPEFRTVNSPSGSEHTTTARYPNVFAAFPVGKGWVVSAGASTLLDRTSTTEFNTTQILSSLDTVAMHTTYRVDGAMSDVRLAAAYNATTWLRFGVGLHGITGHNLVSITQAFPDSSEFASFNESLIMDFSGLAASAGVQMTSKDWALGVSGRLGGNIHTTVEDTVLSRAKVPSRFGASLAFTGIANSAFAIRTSHEGWSSLNGLATDDTKAVDSWDSSIGADIAGPKFYSKVIFLRLGARNRKLPYQAGGHDVTENSGTGGFGTTFANGRVLADFAAIYANRSAGLPASEHAWTLSFGIAIRP
jgi:hypothetical protein